MRVAIVVIGLDEGPLLERALTTAQSAALAAPFPCEVLYSDAGSSDGSRALARRLGLSTIAPLTGTRSAAAARNAGWRATHGEWVQFLDGDMGLDAAWLERALEVARDPRLAAVGGRLDERRIAASPWNTAFGHDWPREPSEQALLGGAGLWRRSALEALGGFDERLPVGEDPDLCLRAREAGWRVRRIDAPMADHDLALGSFRAYWRRATGVGRSQAWVARAGPERRAARRSSWRAVTHSLAMAAAAPVAWAIGPSGWALLALGALAVLGRSYRRDRRRGLDRRAAALHALHVHAVKLPIALGVLATFAAASGPGRAGRLREAH